MAEVMPSSGLTVIIGGIHAGRHAYARTLAETSGLPLVSHGWHIPPDDETIVQGHSPADAVQQHRRPGQLLMLADISIWLEHCPDDGANLLSAIDGTSGPLVLVSREAGLGIVPLDAAERRARDDLGRLNQALAERADRVAFVAAGLPLALKG